MTRRITSPTVAARLLPFVLALASSLPATAASAQSAAEAVLLLGASTQSLSGAGALGDAIARSLARLGDAIPPIVTEADSTPSDDAALGAIPPPLVQQDPQSPPDEPAPPDDEAPPPSE